MLLSGSRLDLKASCEAWGLYTGLRKGFGALSAASAFRLAGLVKADDKSNLVLGYIIAP